MEMQCDGQPQCPSAADEMNCTGELLVAIEGMEHDCISYRLLGNTPLNMAIPKCQALQRLILLLI